MVCYALVEHADGRRVVEPVVRREAARSATTSSNNNWAEDAYGFRFVKEQLCTMSEFVTAANEDGLEPSDDLFIRSWHVRPRLTQLQYTVLNAEDEMTGNSYAEDGCRCVSTWVDKSEGEARALMEAEVPVFVGDE